MPTKKTPPKRSSKPAAAAAADVFGDDDAGDEQTERVDPRTLPPVEESVLAQNIGGRIKCPLTPGCTGRIKVYSTHKRTVKDDAGRAIKRVTEQYLRCDRCGRTPVNPRRVEQPLVNQKLFDRHATHSMD
jgi:hypothetical protein